VDINENLVKRIAEGKSPVRETGIPKLMKECIERSRLRPTTDISEISSADIVLITVGTPLNAEYSPKLEDIKSAPSSMIDKVLRGENPVVYDTGKQTRCFTFIEDEIEGTTRASEVKKAEGKSFNLGSTKETTIADLAKLIIEISGKTGLEPRYVDTRKLYDSCEDLNRKIPDVSKAKAILNWEASTTLKEGLTKTYEWYRDISLGEELR
jgi:nucleoside-diphosphate-sugar epimerase